MTFPHLCFMLSVTYFRDNETIFDWYLGLETKPVENHCFGLYDMLIEKFSHLLDLWFSSFWVQFSCGASDQTANPDDCPFKQEYSDLCSIITNTTGPFHKCHHHVDPVPYYDSCVYDLCLYTPENGMLHADVHAYETACVYLGIQIPEWRSSLRCCKLKSSTSNHSCRKATIIYRLQ